MNSVPEKAVYNWLRKLEIDISFNYLEQKLHSHYDYPSLLSITDTLDALGIDNAAMVVDKEKVSMLPAPFLAYAYKEGSGFSVISNTDKSLDLLSEEFKKWNGVIIAAEKPYASWYNKEEKEWVKRENKNRMAFCCFITVLLLWLLVPAIVDFSGLSVIMLFTSLAGLFIAILIVLPEFGYSNKMADRLCSIGKTINCDAVMKSKGAQLTFGAKWSDAGIIYFSSLIACVVLSILTHQQRAVNSWLYLISTLSLPFIIYSLYYQSQVVQRWCMLCLLTISILLLQFAALSSFLLAVGFTPFLTKGMLPILFSFFFIGSVWLLLLKPILVNVKELKDKYFELLRFRNDPEVFETLLKQQRQVDTTPFRGDIQLGNSRSPVQIIVACNPYCVPCAEAHKDLHALLDIHDFGLTIRFAIDAANREDSKTKVVEHLLKCISASEGNKNWKDIERQVIHDWFSIMNLEKFSLKHPVIGETEVAGLLKQQELWSKAAKIEFTPTIFINGFQMPRQFHINDLRLIIEKRGNGPGIINKKLKI